MASTTTPMPAPSKWAIATVLGYLNDEATHHAEIAKRLRNLSDIDRQEQIVKAITAVQDLVTANFAAA
jgi:hypothetical protein